MPRSAEQPADDAVVRAVLEGRTEAFEILVARHENYVFGLVRKHVPAAEVEDVAQDAFIRAYKALPGYQGKGQGFRAWLASIAVRTCYDFWRRAYRNQETPVSHLTEDHERWLDAALAETSQEILEDRGNADEAREILEAGLARLSPEDRMVLELVYLEGLSGKEAAELLQWSTAKVKVRCFRARRKLEAFLLRLERSERL